MSKLGFSSFKMPNSGLLLYQGIDFDLYLILSPNWAEIGTNLTVVGENPTRPKFFTICFLMSLNFSPTSEKSSLLGSESTISTTTISYLIPRDEASLQT